MKKPRLFYFLLERYTCLVTRLFYRRLQVHHKENVPKEGPLIFVPNHQNAFMDAVVVTIVTPRNPWYLTRASVFGTATARYWLNLLQMIPIYRFRDGLQNVKKNDQTMRISLDLLHNHETILIFAEGNHDCHWMLRPLQKGLARISFAFESANDFKSNLSIVPVGLQYENHNQFRSELLISFGKPIQVSDYKEIYQTDPMKATANLLEDVRKELSSFILDIQDVDAHDTIKAAIRNRPNREKDLLKRLYADKEFVKQAAFDVTKQKTKRQNPATVLLGFPIFMYGILNNFIIYLIIKFILTYLMQDKHWTASFKLAGMIFISPIIYLLQTWLLWQFVPEWAYVSAYFVSLPVSAILAGDYYHAVIKRGK